MNKNRRKKILIEIYILFSQKKMDGEAEEIQNKNKNRRRKSSRNMEEKINIKLQ